MSSLFVSEYVLDVKVPGSFEGPMECKFFCLSRVGVDIKVPSRFLHMF